MEGRRPWEVIDVVPLSKGGASTIDNLRLACSPCNAVKLARSPEEWKPEAWHVPLRRKRHLFDRVLGRSQSESLSGQELDAAPTYVFPTAGWDE